MHSQMFRHRLVDSSWWEVWQVLLPPPPSVVHRSSNAARWSGREPGEFQSDREPGEILIRQIQRGRLRWFGHVERKEENNWVKKCTRMNVIGVVDRGAPRKTWRSCVKRDMKAMGIKEEMAQDRCAWRNITGGPTRASADAWNTVCVLGSRTLNEYDDDDERTRWNFNQTENQVKF